MNRCPRSERVFLSAVDERLTDEERAHARGCANCAAALRAAERFDRELEAAATALAGPPLPPEIVGMGGIDAPRSPRWVATLATVGATLTVVALALGIGLQTQFIRVGAPAPSSEPPHAVHTLHVLVSNHRRTALSVDARTTVAGVTTTTSTTVGGCRGAYFSIALGDAWSVTAGGVLLGAGPPSPVSATAAADLTLRVSYGISAPQVRDGTPADNGLDPAAIAAADLAPCR